MSSVPDNVSELSLGSSLEYLPWQSHDYSPGKLVGFLV